MRFSILFISLLATAALAVPRGFVTVENEKFKLDGKSFYFAGANAYCFSFNGDQADVENGVLAARDAGLRVFRTWGFNGKNRTHDPNGMPRYGGEGAGATPVVYQWWKDDGTPAIDVSPFDRVVDAAMKTDMKLVVALTNNWADYGGMDVYTVNLGGRYHDGIGGPNPKALSAECPIDTLELTPRTVLHLTGHSRALQTVYQGLRHTIQGQPRQKCLGARERASLWC